MAPELGQSTRSLTWSLDFAAEAPGHPWLMGVPPWGTCSLNSPWVLGHCSAASLFSWPCPCPHMRHQPGPGLRGPSGCSQVLSAPAVLALLLVGKRGLRVILAGQWLEGPGSSLLRRAHTRCHQSSRGFYETVSLSHRCSSSLHARCQVALSGLFSASWRPCCAAHGPRGPHLRPVRNLALLGDAHPESGLGSPCQGKEPHVLIRHVEKPLF